MPNTVKRNRVYQLAAANIFSAWAEVLANKIDTILDDRKCYFAEPLYKPEDYFDDSNPNFAQLVGLG